jgi:hypothetical protein
MMVGTEIATEAGYKSRLLAVDAIVVAASANHEVFREDRPTLKSLTAYRWALQPPGAPTRDWLDHAFDRKHLPRPQVQVESTMLLMLPTLIEQTAAEFHLAASPGGPCRQVGTQGGCDQGSHDAPPPRGDLSGKQLPVAGGRKAHCLARRHATRCLARGIDPDT